MAIALTTAELADVRAFIDAARAAVLRPGLDEVGSLRVQDDLDYLQAQILADVPDVAGVRVVAARVQAIVIGDGLPAETMAALTRFPRL